MRIVLLSALLYLLLWPLVAFAGFVGTGIIIVVADEYGVRGVPGWVPIALNLVPALGAGVLVFYPIAVRQGPPAQPRHSLLVHLVRMAPYYAIAFLLMRYTLAHWEKRDFGLYAQLIILPLAATMGAIGADITALSPHHSEHPATRSPRRRLRGAAQPGAF